MAVRCPGWRRFGPKAPGMMPVPLRCFPLLLLLLGFLGQSIWAELPPVPSIEGHITDSGKVLSEVDREKVDQELGEIQQTYKVDLAVHVLDFEVEDLEAMARACFERWSIGKSWEGGGILISISKDLKSCAVVTSEPDKPLSQASIESLKSSLEMQLQRVVAKDAIRSIIARSQRMLGLTRPHPKVYPPLTPRVREGQRYLMGALAMVLLAGVSTYFRRSSP